MFERRTMTLYIVHKKKGGGKLKYSASTSPSRFRDYLLHGNKTEGLEFAMRAGLWGHALFLASKMDQRTYAGVMTRFANGLAITDPLQVGVYSRYYCSPTSTPTAPLLLAPPRHYTS